MTWKNEEGYDVGAFPEKYTEVLLNHFLNCAVISRDIFIRPTLQFASNRCIQKWQRERFLLAVVQYRPIRESFPFLLRVLQQQQVLCLVAALQSSN